MDIERTDTSMVLANCTIPPIPAAVTFDHSPLMQRLTRDDPKRDAVAGARRKAMDDRQLEQKRREAVESALASAGPRYRGVTLDGFELYDDRQRAVVDTLRDLQGDLAEHVRAGRGVFLYGPPGTGKDHLASALLINAAKNHSILGLRTSGVEIYERFRSTIDGLSTEREELSRLVAPAILLVSDPVLPFASMSDHQRKILYRVVDARYERRKSTWATINVSSKPEAINTLTMPIFDRLVDGSKAVFCNWPSYRQRRK